MRGWLLDTNVLSELRRLRPDAPVLTFVASQRLEDLFVNTVTFAEIRLGIDAVADLVRRAECTHPTALTMAERVAELRRNAHVLDAAAVAARNL